MLLRALNLRRLSYAVYAGDRNQFLAQLPVIQERLVDILRPGVVAPIVHSEVYLCMRVLLCRLSPHNLSSFWPVMFTELVISDTFVALKLSNCSLCTVPCFSTSPLLPSFRQIWWAATNSLDLQILGSPHHITNGGIPSVSCTVRSHSFLLSTSISVINGFSSRTLWTPCTAPIIRLLNHLWISSRKQPVRFRMLM